MFAFFKRMSLHQLILANAQSKDIHVQQYTCYALNMSQIRVARNPDLLTPVYETSEFCPRNAMTSVQKKGHRYLTTN